MTEKFGSTMGSIPKGMGAVPKEILENFTKKDSDNPELIRVCICCGGGFSSSAMARHVEKEIKEKGMEDKLKIYFSPFVLAPTLFDYFDVFMVCPHLQYEVKGFVSKYGNVHPVYVLPSKMYGHLHVDDVYQDAKDILYIWKKTGMNPFNFPGEDQNVNRMKRMKAYRIEHKDWNPEDMF
ncbi:MAG: PTS sugar transporter subunit IIB [Bacillota bacterium]|nr:PTS sugar transporter subunit IIB [Bacillota bacterium]